MRKVSSIRVDQIHPPPSPFASRSLTTPTQRSWYCGGGQVPGDGGGWRVDGDGRNGIDLFLGFGKSNIIEQSHLKVALLDDEAVPSFGAELSRHAISGSKWSDSRIPSQKVPLRATSVGTHPDSFQARQSFALVAPQREFRKAANPESSLAALTGHHSGLPALCAGFQNKQTLKLTLKRG